MMINFNTSAWGCVVSANIFLANGEFFVSGCWFVGACFFTAAMIFEAQTK